MIDNFSYFSPKILIDNFSYFSPKICFNILCKLLEMAMQILVCVGGGGGGGGVGGGRGEVRWRNEKIYQNV